MRNSIAVFLLWAGVVALPVQGAGEGVKLPRPATSHGGRIDTVLPPDAIRSIDDPRFVKASAALFMADDEPVIGVVSDGVAKAYSILYLDRREVVNDNVGNRALAVTWCPLAHTGIVYDRSGSEDRETTFGVSGMLWRDALVLYDRDTRSIWSQVDGKALAGPMAGRRLEEIPSEITTWGEWRRKHPDSLVLERPALAPSPYERYRADPDTIGVRGTQNPDERLPLKALVAGLEHRGRFAAIPLDAFKSRELLNVRALGELVVILRTGAFIRRAGGRVFVFESAGEGAMRDAETGSLWSAESGRAIDGPMRDRVLERVSTKVIYWGVWAQFHPRSEIVIAPRRSN